MNNNKKGKPVYTYKITEINDIIDCYEKENKLYDGRRGRRHISKYTYTDSKVVAFITKNHLTPVDTRQFFQTGKTISELEEIANIKIDLDIMNTCDDYICELCAAIVNQAVKDMAIYIPNNSQSYDEWVRYNNQSLQFFKDSWLFRATGIDGQALLRKLVIEKQLRKDIFTKA